MYSSPCEVGFGIYSDTGISWSGDRSMIMGFFVSPMYRLERRMVTVHNPKSQWSARSHSLNHYKGYNLKEWFQILQITDNWVDSSTHVSLLQGCILKKSLPYGKLVHAHFNQMGFIADILLHNTLINMYFKCRMECVFMDCHACRLCKAWISWRSISTLSPNGANGYST